MEALYGFETREPDKRRTERTGMYDIKQLWQRSHEIIGLALQGHKNTVIAEILDITPQTVSNTLNGTLGKKKLAEKREERDEEFVRQKDKISELTEKALKVYNEIFDDNGESRKMQKDVADTVLLELSGHRAAQKIDSRHMSTTATLEEIQAFKDRGRIAAKESGMIIDVTSEPEQEG